MRRTIYDILEKKSIEDVVANAEMSQRLHDARWSWLSPIVTIKTNQSSARNSVPHPSRVKTASQLPDVLSCYGRGVGEDRIHQMDSVL